MDELTPVTLNSHGVGKLVSVLVSVVDHSTPNSLLHSQLEMEAGVRIELTIGVLQFVGLVSRRSLVFLNVPLCHADPENCPKSGTRWNALKHLRTWRNKCIHMVYPGGFRSLGHAHNWAHEKMSRIDTDCRWLAQMRSGSAEVGDHVP